MAKTAVFEPNSSNSFPFGRAQSDVKMKRKTPSELRGEQLKRRTSAVLAHGEPAPSLCSDRINDGVTSGLRKTEPLKIPKYINTRVDEVYPVRKSSERCRVLYGKEKHKDSLATCEVSNDFVDSSAASSFPVKGKSSLSCENASASNSLEGSDTSTKDNCDQVFRKNEKCSQNALLSIVQLHQGNGKFANSTKIDMEKALKGLVARDIPVASSSFDESSGKHGDLPSTSSDPSLSNFFVAGRRTPLDFTLKTSLRFVSSSSVKWCHRLSANPATTLFCYGPDLNLGTSRTNATAEILFSKALQSWVYPQSSLPPSLVTMMSSSAARGETDFLLKRQQDWQDSFQNLYYMLRKDMCSMFYVYTLQFVVLFISGTFLGTKKKRSCIAYISQSTRGLRSLLRKHDLCFSMPLCCAEVEQATEDDLVELSEIEKRNLGQALYLDSLSDVDNSPQSLLSFAGNKNVHGLYDFLLNDRFFVNSLTNFDVPVLYAPVPFQNASCSVPEVRCKEMRKADMVVPSSSGCSTEETEAILGSSSNAICYSIEIKDTILPPWIVCRLCAAMSSDGRSFDSFFTTDPTSIGLNVALDSVLHKSDVSMESNKSPPDSGDALGIPEAALNPSMRSAFLRRLKYSDGSYVAYVTPV